MYVLGSHYVTHVHVPTTQVGAVQDDAFVVALYQYGCPEPGSTSFCQSETFATSAVAVVVAIVKKNRNVSNEISSFGTAWLPFRIPCAAVHIPRTNAGSGFFFVILNINTLNSLGLNVPLLF